MCMLLNNNLIHVQKIIHSDKIYYPHQRDTIISNPMIQ